jgi:hypothetical protein
VADSPLTAHLGDGDSLIVGYVGPDGWPVATRAWSVHQVEPDGRRLRVVVHQDSDLIDERIVGARMAVTGANVDTFESRQVKGDVVAVDHVTAEDSERARRHADALFAEIHRTDGTATWLVERMRTERLVAVEIDVDEVYDQTPGPAAGGAVGLDR